MIGRLKPGVTPQAGARGDPDACRADHPEHARAQRVRGQREAAARTRSADGSASRCGCSPARSAMVMLIVCANLSNLLLARTAARQKEIAIRTALGAGRRRLVAQMLTEGIVLSCSGAIARACARDRRHARAGAPRRGQHPAAARGPHRHRRRSASRSAIAIATGIVFGLAPALQARDAALHDALKDASARFHRRTPPGLGSQRAGRCRDRVRLRARWSAPACSMRSLIRVLDVDMGFQPGRAATIRVDPDRRYRDTRTADRVLRRGAAPREGDSRRRERGHHRRAAARPQPHLGLARERRDLRARQLPARVPAHGQRRLLAAMGIPLRAGPRYLARRHADRASRSSSINETMARALWPGQDPIGKFVLGRAARGTARRRRRRRRAPSRARAGVGQRDVHPDAPVRRPAVRRPRRPLRAAAGAHGERRARRAAARSRRTCPATTSARCSSSWTSRSRRGASWCCCSAGSRCSR